VNLNRATFSRLEVEELSFEGLVGRRNANTKALEIEQSHDTIEDGAACGV
jgi:hypothetical protein